MAGVNLTAPLRVASWHRRLLPWLALLIAVFALGRGAPWMMDRPSEPPVGPAGPGNLGKHAATISLEQKRKQTETSATSISQDFTTAPIEYPLVVAIASNGDAATVSAPR